MEYAPPFNGAAAGTSLITDPPLLVGGAGAGDWSAGGTGEGCAGGSVGGVGSGVECGGLAELTKTTQTRQKKIRRQCLILASFAF